VRIGVLVAVALAAAALAAPVTALAAPEVAPDPASYSFTDTPTTIPLPAEVRFRNAGDLEAELGLATIAGPNASAFYVSDDGCSGTTLYPETSCVVQVRFRGRTAGTYHASLELPSDAPGSPHRASLTGTAAGSPTRQRVDLRATPPFLEFGKLLIGRTGAPSEVVIRNAGTLASSTLMSGVHVNSPGARSSFVLEGDTCAGVILHPGATCRLSVKFRPQVFGPVSALLGVGDRDDWAFVRLTGDAVEPAAAPEPARGLLAARLVAAARRWSTMRRTVLVSRGFKVGNVLQPLAGRIRLEIHALSRERRASLIAIGLKPLRAGTPARLGARTRNRGRRLLRSGTALKLRATLTFIHDAGKPVVVRRSFRLAP
jgi:hypothetical protein